MQRYLLVGFGGFLGAILRYYFAGVIQSLSFSFPIGTLAINVIGSFFLGLIMYSSEHLGIVDPNVRLFLTIGLIGAFTTMSTFGYESFKLLEQNQILLFSLNIFLSVFAVIFSIYLAKVISVYVWGG